MRANQAGSVGLTIRVRTNILSSHQVRLAGNVNVARTAPSETRGQNPKKRQFRGEISPRTRICGALGRPLYLSASETKISYKSLRVTRNMTMKRFRKTKNLRVKLPLFGQLQAHREVFFAGQFLVAHSCINYYSSTSFVFHSDSRVWLVAAETKRSRRG